MAKSVRASVSKRNKAALRAKVFGPAVDARTERLSAKLQELASQPKPERQEESKTNTEATEMDTQNSNAKTTPLENSESMDIDSSSKTSTHGRSGRVSKRQQRKNRSSIVFKPHPSKNKKFSRKK
ncbi:hypothetical protein BDW59DRAFT_10468 [Aspergillus cavernicola]|uniref:DUF2423 domain-containing protein n=1 Tax=Aspergillus cavernicola TaxID=176166 RepID=A0ABR4HNR6_9EURO